VKHQAEMKELKGGAAAGGTGGGGGGISAPPAPKAAHGAPGASQAHSGDFTPPPSGGAVGNGDPTKRPATSGEREQVIQWVAYADKQEGLLEPGEHEALTSELNHPDTTVARCRAIFSDMKERTKALTPKEG
jgi:hypothetical protein